MISVRTKTILTKYLLGLAKLEELAEQLRVRLCEIPDFEPYSYFMFLTSSEKMLQLAHLTQITRNSIKPQGLIAVILSHDTNHCGYLDYHDFLRMTITSQNQGLRQDVSLRPKTTNQPDPEIHKFFLELIEFEAVGHLQLEEIKKELHCRYDFDVYDCFKCLDSKNQGFLDFEDLLQLVNTNELAVHLLGRISCNQGAKKVTYDNFQNLLKCSDNYIVQYSPEKLEQRRLENKSVYFGQLFIIKQAQKMYQMYDSFMTNKSRLKTSPTRKEEIGQMKTPSREGNQRETSTSQYFTLQPPVNKSPQMASRSPGKILPASYNIWTPVRKANANQAFNKVKQFEEKALQQKSKLPLRFSPLQTIKTKVTHKSYKTQSFFELKQFNLPSEYYTQQQDLTKARLQTNVRHWK